MSFDISKMPQDPVKNTIFIENKLKNNRRKCFFCARKINMSLKNQNKTYKI